MAKAKEGLGMIHFNKKCQAYQLVCTVALTGEYPLCLLELLGNKRMFRATLKKMMEVQTYFNDKTKETIKIKVFTIVGKGQGRCIRFLKSSYPILKWANLYEYYINSYGQNNFSGGEKHKERNFLIAETVGLLKSAGFECNPSKLPNLWQPNTGNLSIMPQPCFYHIRDLKGDKNFELKKTIFTRSVGSFFLHDGMYTLYNMGGQMIKLWENGETKMRHSLLELFCRNSTLRFLPHSAILFGKDIFDGVKTLRFIYNKRTNRRKSYTDSTFYSNVLFLPSDETGIRLLRCMVACKNFHFEAIKCCKDVNESELFSQIRYTDFDKDIVYYNLLSCNISYFLSLKKLQEDNPHHKFVVFCHEHQLELVRKILPKNKTIYSFSLKVIESIAGLRPSPEAPYEENKKQNGDT